MARASVLSGTAVAAVEDEYDFTDKQTGDRMQGVARYLWVVHTQADHPVVVKFRETHQGQFDDLAKLLGKPVSLRTEPMQKPGVAPVEQFISIES